jgi:hypothetical protein
MTLSNHSDESCDFREHYSSNSQDDELEGSLNKKIHSYVNLGENIDPALKKKFEISSKAIETHHQMSPRDSTKFQIIPRAVIDANTTFGNNFELKSAESGSMVSNSSRNLDSKFSNFHKNSEFGPLYEIGTEKSRHFKKIEEISTDSPTKRSENLQKIINASKLQLRQETLRELENL